jgi:ribosome-associated heat shock protein Hsp15
MIDTKQRIDTWLWAARFFKTRSLACKAIDAGHVKWNGIAVKPAREVKVGDELEIRSGEQVFVVAVKGVHALRRPAPEARTMYEESEASFAARAKAADMRKLSPTPGADIRGRPTKKDARQIRRVRGD